MNTPIITPEQLQAQHNNSRLIIIDASPERNKAGLSTNLPNQHIPGAIQFSLKTFSDPNSPLPNTLPSPSHFEQQCQQLGINTDSQLVIYDNLGTYQSPRVWWMFQAMGHTEAYVLNGGLPAWVAQGYATTPTLAQPSPTGNFKAQFNSQSVIDLDQLSTAIQTQQVQVIDARSASRFKGHAPEPRQGLSSGHMPHAKNMPFQTLLTPENQYQTPAQLQRAFTALQLDERPISFSCGSGLTACILLLGYHLAYPNAPLPLLYDGSWTEWAQSGQPIIKDETASDVH